MCKICGTEVYTVNIYTPSKSTRSSTEYWGGPVGQIRISPRTVIKKILEELNVNRAYLLTDRCHNIGRSHNYDLTEEAASKHQVLGAILPVDYWERVSELEDAVRHSFDGKDTRYWLGLEIQQQRRDEIAAKMRIQKIMLPITRITGIGIRKS
jgi:hypothetical protein